MWCCKLPLSNLDPEGFRGNRKPQSMALKKPPLTWFKRSQNTLELLKNKIKELNKESRELEQEEKELKKMQTHHIQEMRMSVSVGSVIKATLAIVMVLALGDL